MQGDKYRFSENSLIDGVKQTSSFAITCEIFFPIN